MKGVALVGLAGALLAGAAGALVPPAAWVIDGEVALEGAVLPVATDVVVASGGALHLRGVDVVVASLPGRVIRVTVEAGGRLDLADGALPGLAPRGSRMLAAVPFDLVVHEGGSFAADNVTFEHARLTLASGDVLVERSRLNATNAPVTVAGGHAAFRDVSIWSRPPPIAVSTAPLVLVESGTFDADGARLTGGRANVAARSGATAILRNATFEAATSYAVDGVDADVRIEDSRFVAVERPAAEYAVHVDGGSLSVRSSLFEVECGVFAFGGAVVSVRNGTFATEDRGLTAVDVASLLVEASTFAGDRGLTIFGSSSVVRASLFETVGTAVWTHGADARLEANRFAASGLALRVASDSTISMRGNSVLGVPAVSNAGATPVDARENWWGTPAGPATGAVVGAATVAPWLTSAP